MGLKDILKAFLYKVTNLNKWFNALVPEGLLKLLLLPLLLQQSSDVGDYLTQWYDTYWGLLIMFYGIGYGLKEMLLESEVLEYIKIDMHLVDTKEYGIDWIE